MRIGVFDMQESGLAEVLNPSAVFLAEREEHSSGSVVTVALEGSRPLLVELQALVTPTHFGLPRRTTAGIDLNRLLLLTAVLTKRAGLPLGSQDVFVNVAGGMRLDEPAADLATTIAIASSLSDTAEGTTKMNWSADVKIAGPVGSMGQRVLQPIVNQQVQHVLGALEQQVQDARGSSQGAGTEKG